MKFKWMSLLLASGLVLSACGNDNDDDDMKDDQKDQKSEQTEKENDSQDNDNKDDSTMSDNKSAQKEEKGGLKDISFEKETGEWSYKVELLDGQDENKVLINAEDNSVTNVENEKEDDDDNDKTFKLSDAARFEDALKVAQDK